MLLNYEKLLNKLVRYEKDNQKHINGGVLAGSNAAGVFL